MFARDLFDDKKKGMKHGFIQIVFKNLLESGLFLINALVGRGDELQQFLIAVDLVIDLFEILDATDSSCVTSSISLLA